jgi:predicted transcriptional regulator
MRTTFRLDDRLLREAKAVAAQERRTLTAVMEDALRQFLARRSVARKRVPAKLITFGSGGLRPGVDLDDTAALIGLMEAGEPLDKRR